MPAGMRCGAWRLPLRPLDGSSAPLPWLGMARGGGLCGSERWTEGPPQAGVAAPRKPQRAVEARGTRLASSRIVSGRGGCLASMRVRAIWPAREPISALR